MKLSPKIYALSYLQAALAAPAAKQRAMAQRFWQMVWRRGHFKWYKKIILSLKDLLREQRGVKLAQVLTARALTAEEERELMNKLTKAVGQRLELVCTIRPHLLAGMVVTVDDERYDASLKGRLDSLYSQLAGEEK